MRANESVVNYNRISGKVSNFLQFILSSKLFTPFYEDLSLEISIWEKKKTTKFWVTYLITSHMYTAYLLGEVEKI